MQRGAGARRRQQIAAGLLAVVLLASAGVGAIRGAFTWPVAPPAPAAPAAAAPPQRVLAPESDSQNAAIQQVIQRANDEQAQAIASGNPSVMADTATDAYLQDLTQTNQDLLNNGVSAIQLVTIEWGPISVSGTTATATTFETWSTTFADGTTEQSRDRNDYTLVQTNSTWKVQADTHPGTADQPGSPGPGGSGPAPLPPLPPIPGLSTGQGVSHNWSGYAATGGSFTGVSGTWSVPRFSPDGGFGTDAAWVGIGGVRSRDLIQAGTQQVVSGNGSTQYQAWVETLPQVSHPVPLTIHPGDSVSVSIAEQSANTWLIAFTNNTTGQTYQRTEQYASAHSSAEWVEEAPSGGRGRILPLDDFGTVSFSNGSAIKDGQQVSIAGATAHAITMLGSTNQPLAVPSAIGGDGASFTVSRTDAPATTPGGNGEGRRFPRGFPAEP